MTTTPLSTQCRSRFQTGDLQFLVEHLSSSPSQVDALQRLTKEPEVLDDLLDLEALHAALIDETACAPISPAFYFYVLTRRELLRRGLDDRNLCDYIAGVLTEFTRKQELDVQLGHGSRRALAYLSDILAQIDRAPHSQRYALRRFLADYTLVQSGIFLDNIESRTRHSGAPSVHFYEAIGAQAYRSAAAHPEAQREELRDLLDLIAEAFHEVRLALNALTERALHFTPLPRLS